MTLNNKSWVKNEVFRLYLSGYSQENIAKEVNISVGTVNTLVSEIIKSDDSVDMMRQIAIVSKKTGVDIEQIAANLRWKNKIKQSSLDERKVEKFLDAMSVLFNKYSISPSTAANQFFSLIETMLRDNIEPHRLGEEIRFEQNELQRIKSQVEINDKLLQESKAKLKEEQARLKIKQKDLDDFRKVSRMLELYGSPELSGEYATLARAMIDFKNLNYDPKEIISKYENMISLTRAIEKLGPKLQKSEEFLESNIRKKDEEEAKWKDHYNAIEIFTDLVKNGLRGEDIFRVINIINKDFPEKTISQIVEDIRTYGSLSAAVWRLERKYDAITESML
jgi:transcriptional regulator with XRE-family HTH domain